MRRLFVRYKARGFFVALALCVAYVVSAFAGTEERLIHVFPISVTGDGWEREEHALEQLLGERAAFDDFNRQNAAFVIFPEGDADLAGMPVSESVSEPVQSQGAWGEEPLDVLPGEGAVDDTLDSAEVDRVYEEVVPLPDVTPAAFLLDSFRGIGGRTVHAQESDVQSDQEAEEPQVVEDGMTETVLDDPHVVAPAATGEPEPVGVPQENAVQSDGGAEETRESDIAPSRSVEDDMRSCTVLGKRCHTITFEGFDIGSVLSEHTIEGYTLRVSVAARTEGESFTPDSLMVRYRYRGEWRIAGQVYLDRELSNATEGGHLSFPLPDLDSWDALQDLAVEVEVVRNGTARTEVFLDSVWVDTRYEVASADEEVPLARNIVEELAVMEDSARPDLLLLENERIELTGEMDAVSEGLVIRSDLNVYNGLTTARAYVAVTNTTDRAEEVRLRFKTGQQAGVVGVEERVEDVPVSRKASTFSDVAYFCEAGWELASQVEPSAVDTGVITEGESTDPDSVAVVEDTQESLEPLEMSVVQEDAMEIVADSEIVDGTESTTSEEYLQESEEPMSLAAEPSLSTRYECKATGEVESCSSFNADKTNCIVGSERVSVEERTSYEGGWRAVGLRDAVEEERGLFARMFGTGREQVVAGPLTNVRETDTLLTIPPKGTKYYAVDLSFEVQKAGEFVVEAESDDYDASKSMWWRSAYAYRMPVTFGPSEVQDGEVPVLYTIDVGYAHADLFTAAALDGADVRFYDPATRSEVPMRALAYSYVDQRAEYLIEPSDRIHSTTTLFMYFGNEHVSADSRLPAPALTAEPIPYARLVEPADGAVLSFATEYRGNTLQVGSEPSIALDRGTMRDLFVEGVEVPIMARGPVHVRLSDGELEAGIRSFDVEPDEYTMVTQVTGSSSRAEYELVRYREVATPYTIGAREELPLPAVGRFEAVPARDPLTMVRYLRNLKGPALHEFRESLRDFSPGEKIGFALNYRPQKGKVSRFFRGLFADRLSRVTDVHLMREGSLINDAVFTVTYGAEGQWAIDLAEVPREFVPGKYTVAITVDETGTTYTDSFDFYWGVLVVNTPRSVYEIDDPVEFHMAALDDSGDTICDAELRLTVAAPSGEAEELRVDPQPTCGPNNVTDSPDYLSWYRPRETGRYELTLTQVDMEGGVVHQVKDAFEVRESVPYTVERRAATRIWPKASYVMEVTVSAATDFAGSFVEAIPSDFTLVDAGEAETTRWGGAIRLTWPLELAAGEVRTFRYEYDAPDVSPYIYLLGPAEVRVGDATAFKEVRTWKLASDALGQYVEKFTTITPTVADAWTTIDLSGAPYNIPANAVIEMALINTDDDPELYAGVRHASSTLDRRFLLHEAETTGTGVEGMTTVTVHVTASASSTIQYYADDTTLVTFRILGYWTDGVYVERFDTADPSTTDDAWVNWDLNTYGITAGDVAEVVLVNNTQNASFYAGVRTDGSGLDRRVYLNEAESGGDNYATMLVRATTSTARVESYSDDDGPGIGTDVDFIITGYWDAMPTGLTYTEAWSDLGGPTSNTTWTDRRLDNVSVPPSGIAEVLFGNNANANGAMEIGVRTNGSSLGRVLDLHESEATANDYNFGRAHVTAGSDASSTIEYYTESTASDWFYLAGYWSASNYPPNEPTFYNMPFDNEKTGSSTPYFEFSATDPDGTADIVYQIQWDDDADVATSPLGDEESTSTNAYFVNTVSGGDTSPFTEGNKVRFTMQSALTTGITYYWRVRAKDGTDGLWGEWGDILSFTYVEDTDPKAWIQTEDTQFEQGTLSGVETYGANKVRLATTPPVGAMVAYGTGASTTPNVRTWNGTAWSASSSAQSVGGQISWTVLRGAPTRSEYILGTLDTGGDVNVQVYDGVSGTWGDLIELTPTVSNAAYRGFDIQYLSQSGDAVVAYCDGDADPSFAVWDGADWSSTSTIDISLTQNCEWLSLASSPTIDEVMVAVRSNVAQTPNDYEVQVYSPTENAWGDSLVFGAGEEAARHDIALSYEAGGSDALVLVYDVNNVSGDNNHFEWNRWDGESWASNAWVKLGDDFEWGELVPDTDTDDLALCYIDEDNDIGSIFWNGTTNTWTTPYREHDQNGSQGVAVADDHGRPVTCQYETTAGREGYHMVAYSNTANAEYNYYTGSAWQYAIDNGASVSSISRSWTVGSVRTGEGKILAVFHDNTTNTRYDFSAWDGSAWSTRTLIDDNPSRTAEPWYEPISLAPQLYQQSAGNITSTIADFDLVSGRPSWGEVIWNTDEPAGTDVKLRVYYATTTATCNVAVQEGDLPGNAAGFDVSESPLDLSSLSTSTYNMLCIRADLSSTNAQTPTLNDWSLSWERQPYITQSAYRFYVNVASTTISDIWPAGIDAVSENTPITETLAPSFGEVVRLRLGLNNSNVSLPASSLMLKLQWAEGSACAPELAWSDVGAAGSSTPWRGYDNAGVSDGATLPTYLLSNSDVAQSYEEGNPAVANPNALSVGSDGEWDFVLQHNATSSTNYCFRVIRTDGTLLSAYDAYPRLVTDAPPAAPTLVTPFDNEAVASSSPWFTFSAVDAKASRLHYMIQIDDDVEFGSPLESQSGIEPDYLQFRNITTNDNSPFISGDTIRFTPASSLSPGTYWWRVRALDPTGSTEWGEWSAPQSVTASTTVPATTWFQTTFDQFSTLTLEDVEATSTDAIVLTPPNTVGTATSPLIDFDWGTQGNTWGSLSFTDTGTTTYRIEYNNAGTWASVPDSVLAGNAAGFTSGPVSLLGLDPTAYNELRIVAVLTNTGVTPSLNDWTLSWGYAVEQPTLLTLFDNEKTGTTTPSFTFYSTDPDGDDLVYEINWSTDKTFTTGVTARTSDAHGGFVNTASSTDPSPFFDGDTIRFTVAQGDALTNGTTYWWRVRAKDPPPGGGDAWSVWSPVRSVTVDTNVVVSTWFQTTDEQFETGTLADTETFGSDEVRITTTIREALTVYAEGNIQTPRYRVWNGQSWSTEQSARNVGARIDWVRTAAAPTRDEYVAVTQGSTGGVRAQVYDGIAGTWDDLTDTLSVSSVATYRGYDVAYESLSGDAMVVSCYGQEATYTKWNGTTWSGSTTTIPLTISQNCQWVQLAADPDSNQMVLLVRMNTAGTVDYEALVWNGSTWGNSTLVGNASEIADEGMAVMYEDSGTDAVIVFSDGANNRFGSKYWNGSSWSATSTVALPNDHNKASMCRDSGTDRMTVIYTDENTDVGYAEWDGSLNSWGAATLLEADGVTETGNAIGCAYETNETRDGNIVLAYGDNTVGTVAEVYRIYYRASSTLSAPATISTLGEANSVFLARTGDGAVLGLTHDDDADDYFFSSGLGTGSTTFTWSTAVQLESDANTQTTRTEPLSIVPRRYTAFTEGSVVSSPIVFADGFGPRWGYASSSEYSPSGSYILYRIEYTSDDGETWSTVPNDVLPGNEVGTTSPYIDLSDMPYSIYGTIRYVANLVCVGGQCPSLLDWSVTWAEGVSISGTAKRYDELNDVSGGTVKVAVNGVLQSGKEGTISSGTWTIPNVTMFPGDVIHVWIDDVLDANEAVAVFTYDGFNNATGVELIERHLTIGSAIASTTSNSNLALYDNSASGDEDIFFDVSSGSLTLCSVGACWDGELYVRSGYTYRPDSASGRTITTHDVEIAGTLVGDANNFTVSGSWENRGTSTHSGGTVTLAATSTQERVSTVGASAYAFNAVTFGQSSTTASWTLDGPFDVNGALALSYGTVVASTSQLSIGGNMTIGSSGVFTKGTGTTTFDGTGTAILTDNTAVKQDLGKVGLAGSTKIVRLGSPVKIYDLTINIANTFDVSGSNHALEIVNEFRNAGTFSAQGGTVTFTATSTGKVIDPGTSSFNNLTMQGVGGNWYFGTVDVTIGNNLTVATGTLTLAAGTTTISGDLTNSGGTLTPNNGTVYLTGAGTKTITQNGSSLYTLVVNTSGTRTWADVNATLLGSVRKSNGTLSLPTGTLDVGESFINAGGTLRPNGGALRFNSAGIDTVRTNGSSLHALTFAGTGTYTLADTNLTATGTVRFESGTTTLPSGTFTVGDSFLATNGTWLANGGTVLFTAQQSGRTVTVGGSEFSTVTFDSVTGGWTMLDSATSTGAWNLTNAANFTATSGITITVGGTFTNAVPAATIWNNATLFLNSGTSYTVGTKDQAVEAYGTLLIGSNTDIRMWQSSSSVSFVDSSGSLYSQDHDGTNGLLHIYGTYERTSGTDHWSYATDFDGADISGTPRTATVRFASGAAARYSGGSGLRMVGVSNSTTTLANQGSGSYSLSVTNGTVNAAYYSITDTDSEGFALLGSSTVTSLSDGAFTLTTNGGSMLTVSSTTIDANPAFQPERIDFSTSSGITGGRNASSTGVATSYWWFKNTFGNFDGEAYDGDPVTEPGSLRWDDSGFTISISGTAYAGEGGGGPAGACDSVNPRLKLVVNGVGEYTTSCDAGDGTFTFPAVSFAGDVPLILFMDGVSGVFGATISRTPQGNITGFDLYQNRVIVRHEDVVALTIGQLALYDNDMDSDIPFDVESGKLTVSPETALFVWTGKTFAPGGNVTLSSGGSGAAYDGTLRLDDSSTFIAASGEVHSIGGSWVADSGSTFTPSSSTVVFTATTSGKSITPQSSFNNVTLNGTGGGWTLGSAMTVAGDMSIVAGTLQGTSNLTVQGGSLDGNGTLSLSGGTLTVGGTGTFGGTSAWSVQNLTLGTGGTTVTSKSGSGAVTIAGVLSVVAGHTLEAGSSEWILTGSGSVLSVSGTFSPQTSTTTFAGTSAMNVPALSYHNLVLAPAGGGSPSHTLLAGTLNASSLTVGNGTNGVTANANTQDPLITVSGTVRIRSNATYNAASANDLIIGGSYLNEGTFTANGGSVVMNSSDTGESVVPGASAFHHLTFNNASGGWTVTGNATTTGNFTLTGATNFVQQNGTTLAVQGIFTNGVGGSATDWSGTTLYLNSGTAYSMNTGVSGGDEYGTLRIGANTDIRAWNSTSTTYVVHGTGSLYSQDHGANDGDLYIWGDYVRSSGADHWSYATDFDGTDISGSPRAVEVRFAENATTTLSGGTLTIQGAAGATTTIGNQGSGTYALAVTGGTFSAQYYAVRDIGGSGLTFSGTPTVTGLSNGDYLLGISGGSMITVAASVIDANPVKLFQNMVFATSSGVVSGYNVSATGVSVSSWRFTPGSGNYYGEQYDNDPAPDPDPGYLVFSDSDDEVSISGTVYRDEGSAVSLVCDGTTQSIALVVEGTAPQTTSCASGTGLYSFPTVTGYAPGDTILVYITGTTTKAVNVTQDIVSGVTLDLYEHRVIVGHEDTDPMTIAGLAVYDNGESADIPYSAATTTSPDSLTLFAGHKLIVRASKTFEPVGDVTLLSGVPVDYDGTLALENNATFVSSPSTVEDIKIGGSLLMGTGATFDAGTSTVTFSATTTGKIVDTNTSALNTAVFDGSGGSWTFAERDATTTSDLSILAGTVTFGTSSLSVAGSFVNSGAMSAASTSMRFNSSVAETIQFGGYSVGSVTFAGTGAYVMTDVDATSTGSVLITAGSVVLPSGTFSIANSFVRSAGSFTHTTGTLRFFGSLATQLVTLGGTTVHNLHVDGPGSWSITDPYATTTGTTTVSAGALTGPSVQFGIGGSLVVAGIYNPNAGRTYFFATSTGRVVDARNTVFGDVVFNGVGGGWTVATSATSTGAWRLLSGASFTMASSTTLEVQGAFENRLGGSATDWTDSVLYLNASGTSYTINTKSAGGDAYAYLTLGANTDVRMWDSAGATTTVHASSSLYSMDHGGTAGSLYIYGEYGRTSGADYWSRTTDFDGQGISARTVHVRVASSSVLSYTNSTLQILGESGATTSVAVIGSGRYTLSVSGGTLQAQYYSFRDLTASGLTLSGAVTVPSLSYGDFELAVNGGSMLTVSSATVDQSASRIITNVRFSTSSGVATGTNVTLVGSTGNFWDFRGHYGTLDGEDYDSDGVDACGAFRWDDSTCLEVSQTAYRFRNDDGSAGAPNDEWFDQSWTKRKRVTINNPNASALVDQPVRLSVAYENGMLSDYSALRFTDSSGTTSLPYWVESYTTATATVWVNVPSIPAQDGAVIFMYYGNDAATNGEDGAATFVAFDDFEDGDVDEYDGDDTYFDVVADSGAEGAYILQAAGGYESSQTPDGMFRTGTGSSFGRGNTIRWMQYVTAAQNNEPCTLFGVQDPGTANQNYAVCLDQHLTDKLVLAKNVSSNDSSGTKLASSTVTWASDWYTVEVDWLTSGIFVSVYTSGGTLFATTSVSDSTYTTSGGFGFSFNFQSDGWDFFSVRPATDSEPSAFFGLEQGKDGASWKAAQNTFISQAQEEPFRVRFAIENSGPEITERNWRLEYADRTGYGTCAAVPDIEYVDVENSAGCGVGAVCMVETDDYADGASTQQLLSSDSYLRFAQGVLIEDPSNETSDMTLDEGYMTEVEYAIKLTENATADSYCMRVTNGGSELDSYANIAEVTAKYGPSISNWTLNNDEPIALVEGGTFTVYATGTVVDLNGASDILYATGTVYRSGVGAQCVDDPNNCYQINSLECPLVDCEGNSCTIECSANLQFFADPTDPGSVYDGEEWLADVFVVDSTDNVATTTSYDPGVEVDVLTLWGLAPKTGLISYGALGLGEDTGAFNATTTFQNTGNDGIDITLEGTDMTAGGGSVIPVGNQIASTTPFVYSACTICVSLSGAASPFELDLPKPTSTTPVSDEIYWGVYVPSTGVTGATHAGLNTFYATGD